MDGQAPRVFLSHSADVPHHVERVRELAQWLRAQGLDVRLDPVEVGPEDVVVVVCTAGHLVRHVGDKVVLVVFDDADVDVDELHDATIYRLPEQRDELYQRLCDQPKVRPVPQGPLATLEDDTIDSLVAPKSSQSAAATTSIELSSEEPTDERRPYRRLAIAGALGVVILLAGLFISGAFETERTRHSGQCSIELIARASGSVEDVSAASLILGTGAVITVTIEGNTLYFECPKVAVNARLVVERSAGAQHEVPVTISPGTQQQLVGLPDSPKIGP